MQDQLSALLAKAQAEFPALPTRPDFEAAKARYVGPHGALTALMKQMGAVPKEQRPVFGKLINETKTQLQVLLDATLQRLEQAELTRFNEMAMNQFHTGDYGHHTFSDEGIAGPFAHGVVSRGASAGLLEIRIHDLRNWTNDRHRTVDDRPFGGGEGMVLKRVDGRTGSSSRMVRQTS